MRDFNNNRGGRSGGGDRRHGGGDFRRRDSGPREMFHAVCDECGKDCEVPFRPSGDKPIYCSDCFEKKNGGRGDAPRGRSFGGGDNTNKKLLEQVEMLNAKFDRILAVIEPKKVKVEEAVEVKKKSAKTSKKAEG